MVLEPLIRKVSAPPCAVMDNSMAVITPAVAATGGRSTVWDPIREQGCDPIMLVLPW